MLIEACSVMVNMALKLLDTKMNNITIEFMFLGINMFWARLRHKMSLRRAQNIFMPKNINSITINITLEGTEEIKTQKNDNKTLRRIFFH